MKRFSKKEIFSIPNLMGYFRILLIPVFCYLYITAETEREYLYAALVVLLSSLTDLFDGKIARRFHMVTELGKALDPIADKLTHAALAICLATRYPMMWALIALMLVKEGYMGVMGIIFLKKGKMLDGAMWFGKTVCTFISLYAGMSFYFDKMKLHGCAIHKIAIFLCSCLFCRPISGHPGFNALIIVKYRKLCNFPFFRFFYCFDTSQKLSCHIVHFRKIRMIS